MFTAGRLVRKKGFEYAIDALPAILARHPHTILAIGGSGDLEGELRARAVERGVGPCVRFLGVLPHSDVAEYLNAADVVVVPSVRDDQGNVDGLPNFVLEALSSSTPVVTTAAGGIRSVVRDGVTAAVVAERDPAAIAAAVTALFEDPARAAGMGDAARRDAIATGGWDVYAERLEQVYAAARMAAACRSSN